MKAVLYLFVLFFTDLSLAQVISASLSSSQGIVNPAVVTDRNFSSYSLDFERNEEKKVYTELVGSFATSVTTIDYFRLNWVSRLGNLPFEITYVPQFGNRKSESGLLDTTDLESSAKDSNTIDQHPLQILLGYKLTPLLSIGFKAATTLVSFNTSNTQFFSQPGFRDRFSTDAKVSANIAVGGLGATYQFNGSPFAIALQNDFVRYSADQDIDRLQERTMSGSTTANRTRINGSDTLVSSKQIVGFGYRGGLLKQGSNIELSYERMQPLTRDPVSPGELYRFNFEATRSLFFVGFSAQMQKGYYIDPLNMLPFFFEIEEFGEAEKTEYSFYGGFRPAKGHGVGLFFSSSTEDAEESQLIGTPQKIKKTTTRYSLSYSYLF